MGVVQLAEQLCFASEAAAAFGAFLGGDEPQVGSATSLCFEGLVDSVSRVGLAKQAANPITAHGQV